MCSFIIISFSLITFPLFTLFCLFTLRASHVANIVRFSSEHETNERKILTILNDLQIHEIYDSFKMGLSLVKSKRHSFYWLFHLIHMVNEIKSIICGHIWLVDISKCVYWSDTHSVNIWWRYVLQNANAAHFYDIFSFWFLKRISLKLATFAPIIRNSEYLRIFQTRIEFQKSSILL